MPEATIELDEHSEDADRPGHRERPLALVVVRVREMLARVRGRLTAEESWERWW